MPAPATNQVGNQDRARQLAAVAAGVVLLVASVAGLHHLHRAGDQFGELITWSLLLLGLFTALGGGVKLIMWGLRPVIAAAFSSAKERLSDPVQAVLASLAVIAGVLGMWWSFRGGYSAWWQQITGEAGWSLISGVGQMLVAVLAGAALFTSGKYLFGLAREVVTGVDDAGAHRNQPQKNQDESLWHPGLVAALIGGGLGLVLLTAGITPRLYVWITGPQVLPAAGAIALVLLVAIFSNLGWWKGLAGLYKWATTASQKATATAGVIAVLMFSASGLGLGWFTPATVPQAHAACPPDCGGPGGSDGPPGGGQMFQPPSQGGPQMPDYQGGINQPPLDQNGSISIYNTQAPSVSNNGVNGANGQQGPQQGWDQPAHGTQVPDYQNATPYTQGPGRPNPDFNGGQANPGSNAGSQGGQSNQGIPNQQPPANQGTQQAPSQNVNQQPPQNQPPQQNTEQPNQSDRQRIDELTRQLQEKQQQSGQDRQRIDDLTKQLQQQNKPNQKQQQLPKFPSKDKKKEEDQQKDRDDQSQNTDLASLLLGAASSRRRKEDDQQQPQQQQKGPDTQALTQDGMQAAQGLPGDIQTYVQSGQQIGESSGQAAQGFGSAAQAGASLASSAQSGAVNPQDAITLVQGISQGVQGTADAINAGSQIVKTAQGEADQVAQAVGDANPQLKPQMDQARQLNQQAGQITDLVGQGSQLTSQGAGAVNTASSLGTSGMPDTSGATDALSGTTTEVSQIKPIEFQSGPVPQDVPKPPPAPSNGSVQALDSSTPTPAPKPGEPGFIGPVEARGQGPTSGQVGNEYLNPTARPGHPVLWPDGSRSEMSQSGLLSLTGPDGNPLMPARQVPLQAPTASSSELLDFGPGLSYSGDKTPVSGFAGITQRQLVDQYGVPQGKMSFNADGTPGVMDRGQMRVVDSNNKHQWFWPNGAVADQMWPGKTQPLLGDFDKDVNFLANMIVPADSAVNLTHWEDISTGQKILSTADVVFSVPGVGMVGKIGTKFYRLFKPAEEAANAVKPAAEAATKTTTGAINTATDTGSAASNVATKELSSGSKGNWSKELNNPAANTKYVIDGKHTFMTDDLGRVTRVEGKIDSLAKADRNSYQQGVAGRGDRLPGDEGGHFIASMFGGPGEGINLTAMSANLNSKGAREFGKIEDEWRKIVESGGTVNPTFQVSYPENSLRPSQYVVSWVDQAGGMQQRFLSN
ncbi:MULTISPECIES: DNA/RNA non-specific endonuclease [unclassified Mycobacterium]|uniref:DNA/RNA non-specific endonuclease n=1 Tax=unclassified Mycobacterium TaxID=2642494 RepID=UPI00336BC0D3